MYDITKRNQNIDEDGFILVPIKTTNGGRPSQVIRVYFTEGSKAITLSAKVAELCGFKPGDRVDLYRSKDNKVFKLKRATAGCLTLHDTRSKKQQATALNKCSSLQIRSQNLWLNTVPFIGADNLDKLTVICSDGEVMFGANI